MYLLRQLFLYFLQYKNKRITAIISMVATTPPIIPPITAGLLGSLPAEMNKNIKNYLGLIMVLCLPFFRLYLSDTNI